MNGPVIWNRVNVIDPTIREHADEAMRRVQLLVDTVGAGALQKSSPLHRALRDLNMIAQHGLTQKRVWEWSGVLYFGRQPPVPVY